MSDNRFDVVKSHFNLIARKYDNTILARRMMYNLSLTKIVHDLAVEIHARYVLDIGCGTGTRALELRTQLAELRIDAVDPSPGMIRKARDNGLIDARVCDIHDLGTPPGSYDIIYALFFVICYIPRRCDREAFLVRILNLLRPGGYLVIDAMNRWHLGEGLSYRRTVRSILFELARSIINPHLAFGDKFYSTMDENGALIEGYHHNFSNRELSALLAGCGFSIEKAFTIGYDSGNKRDHTDQGQIVRICRRPI